MKVADYKALGIKTERVTRKSSTSGVYVDHYIFSIGAKVWRCKVMRKDCVLERNSCETLAIAINALANAHDVVFENAPKRVNVSSVEWVIAGELFSGNYPTVGLHEDRQKVVW